MKEQWLVIENPEGDAELKGMFETKKEAVNSITGNYQYALKHAYMSGVYSVHNENGVTKYLIVKGAAKAIILGFDYLIM